MMKIRNLIISLVLVLMCSSAWAQFTYRIVFSGEEFPEEVEFGDNFALKVSFTVQNISTGGSTVQRDLISIFLKNSDGLIFKYGFDDFNKLPIGEYTYRLTYNLNGTDCVINDFGSYTHNLKITKRHISIVCEHNFNGAYNGTNVYSLSEYCPDFNNPNSPDFEEFKAGFRITNLPYFDNTSMVDLNNVKFIFQNANMGSDKLYEIEHSIISFDPISDWTSNYIIEKTYGYGSIFPRPIYVDLKIDDKFYDGTTYINENQIHYSYNGVLDSDKNDISLTMNPCAYPSAEIGEYNINNVSFRIDGTKSGNYQVAPVSVKSSILKKTCPYTIKWYQNIGDTENPNNVLISSADFVYKEYSIGYVHENNAASNEATPYGIFPFMSTRDDVMEFDAKKFKFYPEITYSSDNGFTYIPYKDGDILDACQYVFNAKYLDINGLDAGCESKINVKITPYILDPQPEFNHSKLYDGNNICAEDAVEYTNPDLIVNYTATYDDENSATGKNITVKFSDIEGPGSHNFALKSNTIIYTDGEIKPITPSISWRYHNVDCADQTAQIIPFGEDIKNISAYLAFDTQDLNTKYSNRYVATYRLDHGNSELPGESIWHVFFQSDDNTNLKAVDKSIKVIIEKAPSDLIWNGSDKANLVVNEVKVGAGLSYAVSNQIPQSEIKYQYYISKNLEITDTELFVDANKVEEGYTPAIGMYKLGCISIDSKNYMADGKISEIIEIKKSTKKYPITLPEIECTKQYDGTYDAKVTKPASFLNFEFETEAFFVDGNITDPKKITDADFCKDANSICDVYYKIVVPEEVTKEYNLFVDSYLDNNNQIVYVDYHEGDFIYYNVGKIECAPIEIDVTEIPSNLVYGNTEFGKDINVFLTLNKEIISAEGEWIFWSNVGNDAYEMGQNFLKVGNYSLFADFEPINENYCPAKSDPFNFAISPKKLTLSGELVIHDKVYDGTDIINSNQVVTPSLNGVFPSDEGKVSINFNYSNTKYPSPDVKYTDNTQTTVAAYENIPVGVSLTGDNSGNYVLQTNMLFANSKILPDYKPDYVFSYNIAPVDAAADVKTFRLKYGQSILGVDFQLDNVTIDNVLLDMSGKYVRYLLVMGGDNFDRTYMMQRPNNSDNDFYEIDVQVVEGNREADMLDDTYDVVCHQKIRLNVYKYKLEVSQPNIITVKAYDGNTSVKWVAGNNCLITNAVESDDVKLDGEPDIAYDSPEVGRHKKIMVHYKLGGSNLDRYILPDDIVMEGQITQKGGIDDLVVQSIAPSISPTEGGYCSGDDIILNINLKDGVVDNCNLIFGEQAKIVGFADLYNLELQPVEGDMYQLSFKCSNATFGTYSAVLQLIDPITGKTRDTDPFEFAVNYSSDYLQSKFKNVGYDGDVLVVKDLDNNFVEYQWFKTPFDDNEVFDSPLLDENKQFLYETPYLRGKYAVSMVTQSGQTVRVCPKWFGPKDLPTSKSGKPSVSVYPNPAYNMETIYIGLNDLESTELDDANILIYNSMGSLVMKLEKVKELNTINLPSDSYTGYVTTGKKNISFKFIVRN